MWRGLFQRAMEVTASLEAWRTRLAIKRAQYRVAAWASLGAPPMEFTKRPRVLAVVTHVVGPTERKDPGRRAVRGSRLRETLRGLHASLSHTELRVVINTVGEDHLVDDLPEWARSVVEVDNRPAQDPMWIESRVVDTFAAARDAHDWFFFLEDDLVLRDSTWLEKLAWFNRLAGRPRLLLLPHRYEFNAGRKHYIDLRWTTGFRPAPWMSGSMFELGGMKFGQCGNPHAACHCLNREQLDLWLASPRRLQYQLVGAGPLESAATFALIETFDLYKAAPPNLHFLELEHWDRRYSDVLTAADRGQGLHLPPSELPRD